MGAASKPKAVQTQTLTKEFPLSILILFFILALSGLAHAQAPDSGNSPRPSPPQKTTSQPDQNHDSELPPGVDPENRLLTPFFKHIVYDQKQFWTAPTRLQVKDLKWIVPAAGATSLFILSDSWMSRQVNVAHMQTSLHISDYGTYSLIGLGGASFLFGHMTHNDHLQEAGLLSGEAAINSTAVTYAFKEITQRQRPLEGAGNGNFFHGGASFPSEHSSIAWSIASVWAHEYPGWLSQFAAYGLASTISITRVTAKQHFPTDVIIGSALGWYFGRQVYRAHHDPELGGSAWGTFISHEAEEKPRNPDNMASPYVPVDNWVYPLFDRLSATGYIQSSFAGIRPWTRMECARLLEEAGDKLESTDRSDSEAAAVYETLVNEFKDEIARRDGEANVGARVDSLYTRSTQISGTPLRDGYHFGQTIINDYGRPYWTGFNNVTGVTTWAVGGPFAVYVNGEYQHAPGVPSQSDATRAAEAQVDVVPAIAPNGINQIDRFRLLTATAAFQWANVQISFGQQNMWLGPSAAGGMLFTNNSEPIPMFRIDSVSPFRIPLISWLLGNVHTQFFIGQLSGQDWSISVGPGLPSQPWLHGTKFSFKPTVNLEMGFGYTAQLGGTGNPLTWSSFVRSFYSHKATNPANPAKRLSQFDFSYRVPGLRNWLTIYTDSMVIDEYSPIGSTRPQINPGLFFPQLPKLHKLQLRLEGITTDLNIPEHFGPAAVYWDNRYKSGYTNNDFLIGNWIGRRGRGEQGWATYSFTPRTQLQAMYRHNNVDKALLGGGDVQDASVQTTIMLRPDFELLGAVQYESWTFPTLSPSAKTDVSVTIGLTFWPDWKKNKN